MTPVLLNPALPGPLARFVDLTGHGNTIAPGTVDQTPSGPGAIPKSSMFDGSQSLSSPYVGYSPTGPYSVEFWYKGTDTGFYTAIQNSTTETGTVAGVGPDLFGNGISGGVHMGMSRSSYYQSAYTTSATINDGAWHHVIQRSNPTGNGYIYQPGDFSVIIDGVAAALAYTNYTGQNGYYTLPMLPLSSVASGMIGQMTGYAHYNSWLTTTKANAHIAAAAVSDKAYVSACLADSPAVLWLF